MSVQPSLRDQFLGLTEDVASPAHAPRNAARDHDTKATLYVVLATFAAPLLVSLLIPSQTGNLIALSAALVGIWIIGLLRGGPATSRLHVFYRAYAMALMLGSQVLLAHFGFFTIPADLFDAVQVMLFCVFFGTALLGISRGMKLPVADPNTRYQVVLLVCLQIALCMGLWFLWHPGGTELMPADLLIRLVVAAAALSVLVDPGHMEELGDFQTRMGGLMANTGMALFIVVLLSPPTAALWPLYLGVVAVYGPVMLWNAKRAQN